MSSIKQEIEGTDESNWQTAYDEQFLNEYGTITFPEPAEIPLEIEFACVARVNSATRKRRSCCKNDGRTFGDVKMNINCLEP
jgi:hypothetical protein